MKSFTSFTILCLLQLSHAFSQDYQTVYSSRISYFSFENNISTIRMDSLVVENDSIFYPHPVIHEIDYMCFSPTTASWIGEKVIIRENGDNLFFNKYGDTLFIATHKAQDSSWVAFEIKDSLTIKASVSKHDTMNFLGLNDSIKTIHFQVYNKSMDSLDFPLNHMELLISKNHGFVQTFNFFLFPFLLAPYENERLQEYNIIGLSEPKSGLQNLTMFDVFDYEPGDELHILEEDDYADGVDNRYITKKTNLTYLSHTKYGADSIIYQVKRRQSIEETHNGETNFTIHDDTITQKITPDPDFDSAFPGESIVREGEAYSFSMTTGKFPSKTDPGIMGLIWGELGQCWSDCCADGCFPAYTYRKGLGGPYYYCDHVFAIGGRSRSLEYYRKGDETWGEPLIITSVVEKITSRNLNIYPIPARDLLFIEAEQLHLNIVLNILDLHGKIIYTQKMDIGPHTAIDISALIPGVYFYKLQSSENILKSGKLLIQK